MWGDGKGAEVIWVGIRGYGKGVVTMGGFLGDLKSVATMRWSVGRWEGRGVLEEIHKNSWSKPRLRRICTTPTYKHSTMVFVVYHIFTQKLKI